jgi:hypothetical protein
MLAEALGLTPPSCAGPLPRLNLFSTDVCTSARYCATIPTMTTSGGRRWPSPPTDCIDTFFESNAMTYFVRGCWG